MDKAVFVYFWKAGPCALMLPLSQIMSAMLSSNEGLWVNISQHCL